MVVVPQMQYQGKPCDGSFVKMASQEVTRLAKESLSNIENRKSAAVQRLIDKRRKLIQEDRERARNSIWCGLFGYKEQPMPTDEEILHQIKTERFDCIHIPETTWIDIRYEKYEDVAYRLLNAAKHADEIYVSTQDLERLL